MLKKVWRLGYGPCWCQGVPSESSSFDLSRLASSLSSARRGANLLVVTDRIVGAPTTLRRLLGEIPQPRLVISVAACPATKRFWDSLPGGWIALGDLVEVDAHVDDCVNGKPESLLTAVLDALDGPRFEHGDDTTTESVEVHGRRIPEPLAPGGV